MTEEIEEISDEKWLRLLASKRHDEIATLLKKIIIKDDGVKKSVLQNNETISNFLKKVEHILNENVDAKNNNKELISLFKEFNLNAAVIKEGQNKMIELLSIKPVKLVPIYSFNTIQEVNIEWKNV